MNDLPEFDLLDGQFEDEEVGDCQRCNGSGLIMVCIDDMCRGSGECIHGDGEVLCPECKGENAF